MVDTQEVIAWDVNENKIQGLLPFSERSQGVFKGCSAFSSSLRQWSCVQQGWVRQPSVITEGPWQEPGSGKMELT